MENNFEEHFEVVLKEDGDSNRASFYIYNGLMLMKCYCLFI